MNFKEDKPKISVIVPVYKAENYLHKCIDSIVNQKYPNFELILVDDGSPDNSGKICDGYAQKDTRIKVIHKKNEGVSIARNTGIDESSSDLICFIDSDDWVEDNYLSTFIELYQPNTLVSQGILYDYMNNPDKNELFFDYDKISFNTTDELKIEKYNILENGCPYGKIYDKEIINKYHIRFHKDISTHEDHLFVWQYMKYIEKISLSDNVSYHYMKYGTESLSSKFHPSEELILVADLLRKELDQIKVCYNLKNINRYINLISSLYIKDVYINAIYNCNDRNYKEIINEIKLKVDFISDEYVIHYKLYRLIYNLLRMNINSTVMYLSIKIMKVYTGIKKQIRK